MAKYLTLDKLEKQWDVRIALLRLNNVLAKKLKKPLKKQMARKTPDERFRLAQGEEVVEP